MAKYSELIAASNGKLYAAPYSASRVLEIDPERGTTRLVGDEVPGGLIASDALRPDEGLVPSGANKYHGLAEASNGRLCPFL